MPLSWPRASVFWLFWHLAIFEKKITGGIKLEPSLRFFLRRSWFDISIKNPTRYFCPLGIGHLTKVRLDSGLICALWRGRYRELEECSILILASIPYWDVIFQNHHLFTLHLPSRGVIPTFLFPTGISTKGVGDNTNNPINGLKSRNYPINHWPLKVKGPMLKL